MNVRSSNRAGRAAQLLAALAVVAAVTTPAQAVTSDTDGAAGASVIAAGEPRPKGPSEIPKQPNAR